MMKRILVFLLLPYYLFSQSESKSTIDKILEDNVELNSPGINIIVSKDDKIIYQNQRGLANIEHNISLTEKTKFQAGFLSQQFTAYSILLLEQQGKLNVQENINSYLPALNHFSNDITIENLLSHSSGLHDYWTLKSISGWRNDDYLEKKTALEYAYNQKELNFIPGSKSYYCNTNYLLLAEIVSKVAGIPFKDFVSKNIIENLNLNHTFFNDDFNIVYSDKANYYFDWGQGWQHENIVYYNPGTVGLITSSEDFGKWLLHLNQLHKDNDIIWKKLTTKVVFVNGDKSNFTSGFQKVDGSWGTMISQDGFYNGYRSHMAYLLDENIGILVWSNNMASNAKQIASAVLDQLMIKNINSKTLMPPDKKDNNEFKEFANDQLEKYTGYYFDESEYHTKSVYLQNDTLYLHDVDYDDHYKLIPITKNRFKLLNSRSDIVIEFAHSEKKRMLNIYRNENLNEKYKEFIPRNYTETELNNFKGIYHSELLNVIYKIEVDNGNLLAKNNRIPDIELRPKDGNMFVSNEWFFSSIQFRIENDTILGFYVNTPEVINLYFRRLD